jgi:lysyl-tRNA synthetase class 2
MNDNERRDRRTRRIAGGVLALAGLMDLLSAITPPLAGRIDVLRAVVPTTVEQAATALVAAAGIALLLLSRGVRRGQRHAWALATAVAGVSAVLHIVKGLDVEEAAVTLALVAYLLYSRAAFRAAADRASLSRALRTLALGGAAALAARSTTLLWLPGVVAGWLVFRPVLARRHRDLDRARDIVRRHGTDTLAYFALRDDKEHWFWNDTVVAYAVHNGVCLVSPDPIGPVHERAIAWREFRTFVDQHGWPVAVMGAGEDWRPVYRATGMRDLYVGDEAIVDVRTFGLEGGKKKGLRQAVNRVAKYGYSIEFRDPAQLEPLLASKLRALMCESRRGEVERGFSMTLGRVFCPDDDGLLLAVCFGPDGEPAAFCQYVPSADIDGYSLDLMRRSEHDDHPNGLTDFVVVRTIEHLRRLGHRGLGLNFAVMRSVLAEQTGDGIGQRIERRVLCWLSQTMQIESLWKYNAKFDPDWRPRYAVYDAAENILPSAVAVAKAESFYELPLVGRLFTARNSQQALHLEHVEPAAELASDLALGAHDLEPERAVQGDRGVVAADDAGDHRMEAV